MGPRQTAVNTLSYGTRSRGEVGRFGTPLFSLRLRGAQHFTYKLEAES